MSGGKYDGLSVHSSISMSKEDNDDSKESKLGKIVNLPPLHKHRKDLSSINNSFFGP